MSVFRVRKSLIAPVIFGSLFSCGESNHAGMTPSSEPAQLSDPGAGLMGMDGVLDMMMPLATPDPMPPEDTNTEGGVMPVGIDDGQEPPPPVDDEETPLAEPPPVETPMEPKPEPVPPEEPEAPPCEVAPITDELRESYDLDPFYQKFALARGVPVISSNSPADAALIRTCELLIDMLSAREDVVEVLLERRTRFGVIAEDELTNDIPEYRNFPDTINTRARGLGGEDIGTCAEESIMCNRQLDRWRGEGICVHEFAHTISAAGLFRADPTFQGRLRAAFDDAEETGKFANTYSLESFQEYWAEGVQDWYNTNLESIPSNGIHNEVDKRAELITYDPTLYGLIAEFLPDVPRFQDCYADVPQGETP